MQSHIVYIYTLWISLIYGAASRHTSKRQLGAFVSTRQLSSSGFSLPRDKVASGLPSHKGISTRRAVAPFQVAALHNDVASFLEQNSIQLYGRLSQGSYASPSECLMASAAYVLPLMDSVENFGEIAKPHLPELLKHAIEGVHQLSQFYSSVPFLSYTMSTLIYSGLVKKEKLDLSYFLRYHLLQSLILSSFQNSLAMFYFKLLPLDISSQDFLSVVSTMSAVLTSFGAVIYCAAHALMGRLTNLPVISDAVKLHIGKEPSNVVIKRPKTEEENSDDEE